MGAAALPIGLAAGSALLGGINAHQKKVQYNQDKQTQANIERWSPWTGQHGQMPAQNPAGPMGDALGGAFSGGMLGMNINGANAAAAKDAALADQAKASTSAFNQMQNPATLYSTPSTGSQPGYNLGGNWNFR